MPEKQIIENAIANLDIQLGIKLKWMPDKLLDGKIELIWQGKTFTYIVEVKKELRTHQLNAIYDLKNTVSNLLMVANRIYPKEKEQLRLHKIPYIETNGNIYVENQNMLIWIDNMKTNTTRKEVGNRAFTKTGLKVLFQFMNNPELVNKPHRDIAHVANVALGNIPQVINGLKETGYLQKLDKKTYVWNNRKQLLERWIADYNTILKPGLQKATFKLPVNYNDVKLNINKTVWGGEPAADLLTNYLRPEKYTIYTEENQLELIKNYKFIPDPNGELTVYEKFWIQDNLKKTAPPLIVYADLVMEGGKRNLETAKMIFDEHIEPNL